VELKSKRKTATEMSPQLPSIRWAQCFVQSHTEIKTVRPIEVTRQKLEATYKEVLKPFLLKLQTLSKDNNYHESLFFQLDETSNQVQLKTVIRRIIPASQPSLFQLTVPPIYNTTTLFIISADGYHQNSHILLPNDVDLSSISHPSLKFLHVHQSSKRWMTKQIFEHICFSFLIPAIVHAKAALPEEKQTRALLLLDGATAHYSLNLR
jgi:hypothetical protein